MLPPTYSSTFNFSEVHTQGGINADSNWTFTQKSFTTAAYPYLVTYWHAQEKVRQETMFTSNCSVCKTVLSVVESVVESHKDNTTSVVCTALTVMQWLLWWRRNGATCPTSSKLTSIYSDCGKCRNLSLILWAICILSNYVNWNAEFGVTNPNSEIWLPR